MNERRSYFAKVNSYFIKDLYEFRRVEGLEGGEGNRRACICYWFPIFSQTYPAYISMPWKWNSRRHSARLKVNGRVTSRVYMPDICLSISSARNNIGCISSISKIPPQSIRLNYILNGTFTRPLSIYETTDSLGVYIICKVISINKW